MDRTALVYAAWAGHCLACGHQQEAAKYQELAERTAGRIILGHVGGGDSLYVVSETGEPSVEDVDYLIASLNIMRDGCKRRAEKKAAAAELALPPGGQDLPEKTET